MLPDLTQHGLTTIKTAVNLIRTTDVNRVDVGQGTIVYRVPSNNPRKYTIRVDMKIEEEE